MDWKLVNENMFKNLHCRLDKLELEEGILYRHMIYDSSETAIPAGTALVFVEKKGEPK